MGWALDRLAWFLLDAGLASAALLTAAALAMVGTAQPVRRCGLARGALLGSILLLPLVALRPCPRLDVVGGVRQLAPPLSRRTPPESLGLPGRVAAPLMARRPWLSPRGRVWLPRVLAVGYLAGVGWRLAWLGLGCWGAGWLSRRSTEPSEATLAAYEALPFAGRRRPRLRVASRAGRPVLLGVVRPLIVIPPELDRPDARERLRLSLLHELVHAERLDPGFGLVANVAEALWFFLPPLWWMRAQMRLDQEFLADHDASAGFGPFGSYAASLVDLADAAKPAGPTRVHQMAERLRSQELGASSLVMRVLMLVRCPFPVELRAPLWWRLVLPPALAVATLLASALSLQAARPRPSPRPPAAAPPPRGHAFTLSQLTLDRPPLGPDGRARPYPLLLRLPPAFRLSVEICGDATTLPRVELLGRRLALDTLGVAPDPSAHDGWYHVQMQRDAAGLAVWIDGRRLPDPVDPTPIPEALTIQPAPLERFMLRNLQITW